MKTTIEIPDDLFRAVKARAAMEDIRIKDLMARLLTLWLEGEASGRDGRSTPAEASERARRQRAMTAWLAEWQTVGQRIEEKSVDPRSMQAILDADRR
jgi:hypothetical protein